MIAILIRLVLLLLPVILVVYWLRRRAQKAAAGDAFDHDLSDLRRILMVALGVLAVLLLSLYFFNDEKCGPNTKYIPAKVVDGELQPKQCVPITDGGSDIDISQLYSGQSVR